MVLEGNLAKMFEEAKEFIKAVNKTLLSDEYIKSLDISSSACQIQITETEHYNEQHILNTIQIFIYELQCGLQSNFLAEFDPSVPLFQEFSFLDLTYLKKFLETESKETISLKELCNVSGVDNEQQAIEELCTFEELYRNSRTTYTDDKCILKIQKRTLNADGDENDGYFLLVLEGESDLESDLAEEDPIDIQNILLRKCYCTQCVLRFLDKLNSETGDFQNLFQMYKYVAIIPCTEVKCESAFSTLKITKNRLRTTITEANLQNLMIISNESDMLHKIDIEDIINEISKESVQLTNKLL